MAEVYVFAAWSGTGKTAYLERLIPYLNQLGLTAAVVKHDVHGLALDRPGKDSHRLFAAGAEATAVVCGGEVLLHRRAEPSLEEVLALLPPTDLVLVEGFKSSHYPKIAVCRAASGKPLAAPEECLAVVTDTALDVPCPQFPLDKPEVLAAFLAARHGGG
ncbi:molybdopterin-guanine dinucleotide biosynthesis protein B [uncultured Oscillibacter sp.]|uniref:molybdopterin-guanine dinucleotide biosynthesis protein B n=1 Tax=uncultured Oscillibacter sp. TaxID=876091 RepID=UPI0025E5364E|nr:molybdopterin-guanine dinucleotide biosynthesis protein B [uncultured Oscillibacter sp.]